jgi:hypothetical protein
LNKPKYRRSFTLNPDLEQELRTLTGVNLSKEVETFLYELTWIRRKPRGIEELKTRIQKLGDRAAYYQSETFRLKGMLQETIADNLESLKGVLLAIEVSDEQMKEGINPQYLEGISRKLEIPMEEVEALFNELSPTQYKRYKQARVQYIYSSALTVKRE